MLGTRDDDNILIAEQLTVDLKPDLPSTVSLSLSTPPSSKIKKKKIAGLGRIFFFFFPFV